MNKKPKIKRKVKFHSYNTDHLFEIAAEYVF